MQAEGRKWQSLQPEPLLREQAQVLVVQTRSLELERASELPQEQASTALELLWRLRGWKLLLDPALLTSELESKE